MVIVMVLHCRAELLAKLQAGTTYVVDRYAYSGAAFTAAQLPVDDPAGRDLRWCQVSCCLHIGSATAASRCAFASIPWLDIRLDG